MSAPIGCCLESLTRAQQTLEQAKWGSASGRSPAFADVHGAFTSVAADLADAHSTVVMHKSSLQTSSSSRLSPAGLAIANTVMDSVMALPFNLTITDARAGTVRTSLFILAESEVGPVQRLMSALLTIWEVQRTRGRLTDETRFEDSDSGEDDTVTAVSNAQSDNFSVALRQCAQATTPEVAEAGMSAADVLVEHIADITLSLRVALARTSLEEGRILSQLVEGPLLKLINSLMFFWETDN